MTFVYVGCGVGMFLLVGEWLGIVVGWLGVFELWLVMGVECMGIKSKINAV